jgi:hypothetical protein
MIHHGPANRLTVSGTVEFGDNPPPRHDTYPVGQSKDFVEILADEDDGRATIAGG